MKSQLLAYGSISGLTIIVVNTISIEVGIANVWLGYLVMLIAFSCIFVAIKKYRDLTQGGVIRFGTAFGFGLGITLVASFVYVGVWELYLFITDYAFIEEYARLAEGGTDGSGFADQYSNLLFRLPVSFLEVFPVGVLVSLISAAMLRNHRSAG